MCLCAMLKLIGLREAVRKSLNIKQRYRRKAEKQRDAVDGGHGKGKSNITATK